MKTAAQILAVASAFTAVYAQNPIIQSPASLVQCQPALVTFSGGTAPYYISVLPGGQASAAALEQFPPQSGNSYTWTVNIASGQDITLSIRDSTGAINYSSQVPIQPSLKQQLLILRCFFKLCSCHNCFFKRINLSPCLIHQRPKC
ncbi:hypothetical protein P389DRAFT_56968 [Cystobasidium minutum MCA 4210]|uniref:uncharacterized protein n=1 Tax=Cystobasidium minutum MCA 4210 TaxID=1397322 RepID=UPI0034CFAA05|eukprot:jgi/Rhomi1/56968/CE56967_19236